MCEGCGFGIEDCIGRAVVAIPGLAYAAGVDHHPFGTKCQRSILAESFGGRSPRAGPMAINDWHMGMPHQTHWRIKVIKVDSRNCGGQHIFPNWVTRTTVHERELTQVRRHAFRQGMQPIEIINAQLIARPERGAARVGIELFQVQLVEHSPIVIARKRKQIVPAQNFDAGIRFGAIADHIAQAPDAIKATRVGDDRVQCHEVCVDIGKDQYSHRCLGRHSTTSWGKLPTCPTNNLSSALVARALSEYNTVGFRQLGRNSVARLERPHSGYY